MNIKHLFGCITAVGLVALASVYFGGPETAIVQNDNPKSELVETEVLSIDLSQIAQTEPGEPLSAEEAKKQALLEKFFNDFPIIRIDENTAMFDPEHFKYLSAPYIQKRQEWLAGKGYFYNGEVDAYDTYDIRALEALADQGDLVAIHALIERHMDSENTDREKLFGTYVLASVHGSTNALVATGHFHQMKFDSHSLWNDDIDRASLVNWMAFNEVAVRRGDIDAGVKLERNLASRKIEVSEADRALVEEAADIIYASLAQERAKLGLDEFDNSVPDYISGYRNNLEDMKEIRDFVAQVEASP